MGTRWQRSGIALEGLFNWKMAVLSAGMRAAIFFCANLRAGHSQALRATLVEAVYATISMGLLGTLTERIRNARPAWLTALAVWAAMPLAALAAELAVHHAFATPRLRTSMIASFIFSALGSGFSWFAMRRGAFLVGEKQDPSFAEDLRAVPLLVWEFVTAGPRAIWAR